MASSEDTVPTPSMGDIKTQKYPRTVQSPLDPVNTSIMNSYSVVFAFALAAVVVAEPPSGYNYNRPSGGGGGGGGGGYSFGGGGGLSLGGGLSGGGGGYTAVSSGGQTNEGASVDSQLLEQVRQILLKEEQQSGGGGGGSFAAPSSQYGVPSPQYGVPSQQYRVVGIDLEGIKQAIQVAQYNQVSQGPSIGGYPSGPSSLPSGSYGAPY